jgi:hypothetical protein
MTKTQRNKTINKIIYQIAESLGYEVDMTEIDVTFISPSGNSDDNIQYRRSSHTVAALNWASEQTLNDEKAFEIYIKGLNLLSDEELLDMLID